jgi:ribosomal protein S18 acetylase RimI-like enzyme
METIRPAEPRDADFLGWVILAAARSHVAKGWFDIALARPEPQCLEYLKRLAVTEARSWWHYSRFHIAEVDGNRGAALCAFRAGDAYPLSAAAMVEVSKSFGWDDAEQQAMWTRGAYVFTCTFEDHDDWWTIENVATLPEYRGRGLVGKLIDHVLAEGRRQALQNTQISFFIGNSAAERAYSKAGFVFDGERRHADFEAATGVPGIRRFLKPL